MVQLEIGSSAPVREGKSLASKQSGRLGVGAIITEHERIGERLRFQKLSGPGPEAGWISAKNVSKATGPAPKGAAPVGFVGTSLLAVAEAAVAKEGPTAALAALAATKAGDGPTLVLAAVAHLASGNIGEGLTSAQRALELLAGKPTDAASARLAVAAARLAKGDAKEALVEATEALAAFKAAGDKQMEASAMATSANAHIQLKELAAAVANAKDALAIFREIADTEGEAATAETLNDALVAREGPMKAAKSLAAEKMAYCQGKADKEGQAAALHAMASAAGSDGDLNEATRLSNEALGLFKAVGDRRSQGSVLLTAALAQLFGKGGSDAALDSAQRSLMVCQEIDDTKGQAEALVAISKAQVAKGLAEEAVESATKAKAICEGTDDKASLAAALHAAAAARLAGGDAAEALTVAKEALALFKEVGDKAGEASTLHTAVNACVSKGGSQKEALAMAREAAALSRHADDARSEGVAMYMTACVRLQQDGGAAEALMAADRARAIFLTLGEKRSQGLASHVAAQAQLHMGFTDEGMNAAMQAVVLARDVGDRHGEAAALHTAAHSQLEKGCVAEGLRMAKEVQRLYQQLGSQDGEALAEALVSKVQQLIPTKTPGPRTYIQPMDDARLQGQRSLFQEHPNCVVWTVPVNQHTYIMYCLELLKLVDDIKNVSGKTSVLVCSQAALGRQVGETQPGNMEGVMGNTVWSVVRTIRLESPRLHIATVDLPAGASAHEVTECLRAAQMDSGNRNEIAFTIDRKQRLAKNAR